MGGASAGALEAGRVVADRPVARPLISLSYIVPWRSAEPAGPEAVAYLRRVAGWCQEVVVIDGSPPNVFETNASSWGEFVRHRAPDPGHRCLMGKVAGVLTGVETARHEMIVLADDDVRYQRGELERVAELLQAHDLVRPQNYFDPLPWHAAWDTARTLLNRSLGADFPGTLALRRSVLMMAGGYSGDVMFENLELIRTVQAAGGRIARPLDLYVRRLPPSAWHFWGQRTRQAYDDFALPARMTLWLSVVPALGVCARRRSGVPVVAAAGGSMVLAESGRRRAGGRRVFKARCSLLAPAWILERGVCAWLAVLQRLRFGGVRYGTSVIRVAAHSPREIRRRLADEGGLRAASGTGEPSGQHPPAGGSR